MWRGVARSRGGKPPGGIEGQDLAAEAITDLLEGKRSWDQSEEPDLLRFLKGVVDSKVSHLVESIENRVSRRMAPAHTGDETSAVYELRSSEPDPCALAINNDEAQSFQKLVCAELKDDEQAFQVFECLWADMRPQETAEYLGCNIEEVRNAQKRLRRKLEKIQDKYKKGGKHG
jgi:DNA-directed RNA polymerase specialized sigma24 family protein